MDPENMLSEVSDTKGQYCLILPTRGTSREKEIAVTQELITKFSLGEDILAVDNGDGYIQSMYLMPYVAYILTQSMKI